MMQETVSGEQSGDVPASTNQAHRVLLVADEVFRGSDLAHELKSHLGEHELVQVFVITPSMAHNAVDQELGNIDETIGETGDRLKAIIAELHGIGIEATGEIGDLDPLVAVGDGVREFRPDEIVVVSHVESERAYAERNLWDTLSTDYHQPVTQLRVGHPDADGGAPKVQQVEHSPAHEKTQEEVAQETRNFPKLKNRDIAGILIGIIGTIALGMIALGAGTDDGGELSGSAAIILLIAIAAFLINVAHIVGLLFFESVRYTGFWERAMSRMSMIFTPVALVVCLALWLA